MHQLKLEKIHRLLRRLGLRVSFGRDVVFRLEKVPGRRQKQRTIVLPNHQATGLPPDTLSRSAVRALCHELGHYLVAPEGRRRRADYGIPEKSEEQLKWRVEEVKAVMVQHALLRRFGIAKPGLELPMVAQGKDACEIALEWWKQTGKARTNYTLDLLMV